MCLLLKGILERGRGFIFQLPIRKTFDKPNLLTEEQQQPPNLKDNSKNQYPDTKTLIRKQIALTPFFLVLGSIRNILVNFYDCLSWGGGGKWA